MKKVEKIRERVRIMFENRACGDADLAVELDNDKHYLRAAKKAKCLAGTVEEIPPGLLIVYDLVDKTLKQQNPLTQNGKVVPYYNYDSQQEYELLGRLVEKDFKPANAAEFVRAYAIIAIATLET